MTAAPKHCALCSSNKVAFCCENCGIDVCKSCGESLDSNDFSFFTRKPEPLSKTNWCCRCYDEHIAPIRARYDELMEKAKQTFFLTKNFRGYVKSFRRHTKRVSAGPCLDRRECILRMAFMAAELGFNSIIEAEVSSKKVRIDSYQTSSWQGSAQPADIDGERLERAAAKGF